MLGVEWERENMPGIQRFAIGSAYGERGDLVFFTMHKQ
jgi:hypothetical protein